MSNKNTLELTPIVTLDFSARLQEELRDMSERMQMKERQEQSYQQKRNSYLQRGDEVFINPVTIQLSLKQIELVETLSSSYGVSKSAYLREIIDKHLQTKYK